MRTIAIIIAILLLFGMVSSGTVGGLIPVLLVLGIVMMLLRFIKARGIARGRE